MSKITAALIVRDCATTIGDCLASIRPHVDQIVCLDTGSTDETPAICRQFADKVETYTGCNRHPRTGEQTDVIWDFADARNKSFELVDTEWVWWQDGDDVVLGAETLRPAAESAPSGPFAYLAPYEYSYDGSGRPTCVHWRERLIHNPRDFVWTTPCHEVCVPRSGTIAHAPLPSVVIKHRAQEAATMPGAKPREPARNLRILETYMQLVHESDIRAMYYLGVERARHGQMGKAREILRRYVQLSNWDDERCLAELELARIYLQEGDCQEAIRWAMQAMTTKDWPNAYWVVSKIFFRMAWEGADKTHENDLRRAVEWARRGRMLPDAQTVLFYDPTERFTTERHVARVLAHWGELDEAAEACRRGLSGLPGDPELMEQLRKYETVRIGRDLDTSLSRLVHLGALSEPAKHAVEEIVAGRIQVGPAQPANDVQQPGPHPFDRIGTGAAVDEAMLPPVPEGKLDIVIVTGPAFEDWTPKTIEETGIGGSETMAWEMARHLARLGHRVRHYGWCKPEQEGVYEGVHWFDSARYRDIECDALIVSRYADLVQCVGGTKAKARLLWVHDVHCGPSLTAQHALRFDKILCLSHWHKSFFCQTYPFIDPERVTVTRNGIDLSLFEPPSADSLPPVEEDRMVDATDFIKGLQDGRADPFRNPHRAVYSSSPDRGLQTALELWPLVRTEVPDAELHVFYGFDGLRKFGPGNVALADKLEAQCKATEGVVLHGRVSPRELAREFMRSGVWFYPTWFSETSCITAMQAQAAGLRIVTSPIAALNETCGELVGTAFIPGAPGPINMAASFELAPCSPEYKAAAVKATVEALNAGPFRIGGARIRERFGLVELARDWNLMLHRLVADQDMPRFYVDPAMAAVARETDAAA